MQVKVEKVSVFYIKEDENIGRKYNRWTIIEKDEIKTKKYNANYYWCQCDCKKVKSVCLSTIIKEQSVSCGCFRTEENTRKLKKYNTYDLTGNFGIGYTLKGEPFYFDLKNYDKIKSYCWSKDAYGYLISSLNKKQIKLHRLIMDAKKDDIVDHINGAGSEHDNRECNLRICTKQENQRNRKNAKGYHFNKARKKWLAEIHVNGEKISLGAFLTEEEAKIKRREAELEYFGEFARKIEGEII